MANCGVLPAALALSRLRCSDACRCRRIQFVTSGIGKFANDQKLARLTARSIFRSCKKSSEYSPRIYFAPSGLGVSFVIDPGALPLAISFHAFSVKNAPLLTHGLPPRS